MGCQPLKAAKQTVHVGDQVLLPWAGVNIDCRHSPIDLCDTGASGVVCVTLCDVLWRHASAKRDHEQRKVLFLNISMISKNLLYISVFLSISSVSK